MPAPPAAPPALDHVWVLPVLDRWLVCGPLSDTAALVNRSAVEDLRRGAAADGLAPLRRELADAGPAPVMPGGPPAPQFLGLLPTRACNLGCVYCGFDADGAPGGTMDPRLAAAAVDWMARQMVAQGGAILPVHFFGGEPLAAPDVVEVAVHRARWVAARQGLRPYFEIATNGVTERRLAEFLGDCFDTVVLSCDGPPAIHDTLRPRRGGQATGAEVEATARVLAAADAKLCLRVCVTSDTVAALGATVDWFCEEFGPSVIAIETLQETAASRAAGLRPPEPLAMADQTLTAVRRGRARGVEVVYAAAYGGPRWTFCPVGNDCLIVSPDGRVSGCYLPRASWRQRGLDLDLGWFSLERGMELDPAAIDRLRRLPGDKPRCRGCFCRWTCAGACHVNHSFPGCSEAYDDFCRQTRLITAGLLLDQLGCADLIDALLRDQAAGRRLAEAPSDRLVDWEPRRG